jgi:putative ABC transport system permease protein
VLAVSNTLVMTVFERMRELGTLRAIGTTPGQIAAILAAEAAALGVVGAAAGALLGAALLGAINAGGLQMPPPPGAVDPIDLRLAFVPGAFAGAALLMIVVLLFAALFPIAKAIRVSVVEALGSV